MNDVRKKLLLRVVASCVIVSGMVYIFAGERVMAPSEASWLSSQSASSAQPITAATLLKPAGLQCEFENHYLVVLQVAKSIRLTWQDNGVEGTIYQVGSMGSGGFEPMNAQPTRTGDTWSVTFTDGLLSMLLNLLIGGSSFELHVRAIHHEWVSPTAKATVRTAGILSGLLGAVQSCRTS